MSMSNRGEEEGSKGPECRRTHGWTDAEIRSACGRERAWKRVWLPGLLFQDKETERGARDESKARRGTRPWTEPAWRYALIWGAHYSLNVEYLVRKEDKTPPN